MVDYAALLTQAEELADATATQYWGSKRMADEALVRDIFNDLLARDRMATEYVKVAR